MNRGLSASWKKTAAERDADVGAFLQLAPDLGEAGMSAAPADAGPLAGAPFAVKDNIAVRGFQLSCGSKLLEGFLSPYSATCVERLVAAGAVPVGKTNCDEFGMGSSTENSAYRKTVNPWDASRVPGGSSGGSAAAVAAGIVPFALGSDTGGSVRQPAAFCGVYGLKPTWGAVSRYGLVAYASSLDVVGVVAKTVAFVRAAFVSMRGEDPLDHSSLAWPPGVKAGAAPAPRAGRGLRIGMPREAAARGSTPTWHRPSAPPPTACDRWDTRSSRRRSRPSSTWSRPTMSSRPRRRARTSPGSTVCATAGVPPMPSTPSGS